MLRSGVWLTAVVAALAAPIACAPAQPVEQDRREASLWRWQELPLDGQLRRCKIVRGSVVVEDGKIILNPRATGSSIIIFDEPHLADGAIEVDVLRTPLGDGPYTITHRLRGLVDWTGVYFVCRPERIDVCRGSAWNEFPESQASARLKPLVGLERWRFELAGRRIRCFRNGREVLTYDDKAPEAGRLAITADRCRLEIHRVSHSVEEPKP